ncbi:MAG TPA: D-aminoacyl-tRNA deacylase [Thermoanaerobaculia bacterium]|nr:D-aminoacyl-tRNA deacylase [Thermoanaerobaculia bacterium]HUM28516.1 D-aminoacyl-tRNA deacylase [Thermoanaerobaculia bacterium]HXK66876.1 D-aminoacyl-tRNA deacylase [Thermoanaerobaculia bacterium]
MIICIQRVQKASVRVEGKTVAQIGKGLLLLVGIEKKDREEQFGRASDKIVNLRIFPDEEDKMNRSVKDIGGEILAVSQFTLAGDIRRGRRPSFDAAAPPEEAKVLFENFVAALNAQGVPVQTGVFQALMEVDLVNDGPVTIIGKW